MPTPDLIPPEAQNIKVSLEPWKLFGGIFLSASLAGLAALLRSHQLLTTRRIVSALLNSGFIGTIIALGWYANYKETNLYFLIAVSVLAGLGGATTLDFVTQYIQKKLGLAEQKKQEGWLCGPPNIPIVPAVPTDKSGQP